MRKINKKKVIILAIIIVLIIIVTVMLITKTNVKVKTKLFDLTENEPLKQSYARNQTHYINDIMPISNISKEEYKNFLENPHNYVVYSLRCNVENKSNKEIKAQYEINKDNMWIDTVTMSNANDTINSNSEINKSISILVKLDGKSKETIEKEIKNMIIKVHIYNSKNEQKEITTINSKF